jgi:hypothetical protein
VQRLHQSIAILPLEQLRVGDSAAAETATPHHQNIEVGTPVPNSNQ